MAAETLKKGKGFVSLGGVYADPDDADAARISKLIRSTMTRLHVDINRSIAFYRTTLNGAAPKRVFLTGGSSQLPYLDLFIADKLSLPISYFNPLRNVHLDPSLNKPELLQNNCYAAEMVGLALRATGSCPAEVILDAPTLAARADKRRKQPYYFGALAAWFLLFVCLNLYYLQQVLVTQAMTQTLNAKTENLKTIEPKIKRLVSEDNSLDQTFRAAAELGVQRNAWAKIFADLNDNIPEGVWITDLVPASNSLAGGGGSDSGTDLPTGDVGMLVINGLYHSNAKTQMISSDRLRDFVNALADLPEFDIDKNNITSTLPTYGGGGGQFFAEKFSLRLKLKAPISAKPQGGR